MLLLGYDPYNPSYEPVAQATVFLWLGQLDMSAARFDDAFDDFTEVLNRVQNSYALRQRALAALYTNRADTALADASESIAEAPMAVAGYMIRAQIHRTRGEYAPCVADLSVAIALKPRNVYAWAQRAYAYEELNQWQRSAEGFAQATRLAPDDAENYMLLGVAQGALHQYDEAIASYTTAIRLNAGDASAFEFRGTAYRHIHDDADAMGDFIRALQLDPNDEDAHVYRAELFEALGHHELAIPDYTAILVHNDTAYIRAYRAEAFVAIGDDESARKDADRAMEIDPNDRSAAYSSMQVSFYMGDYARSMRDSEQYVSIMHRGSRSHAASAYVLLWHHLAASRIGVDDSELLRRESPDGEAPVWPQSLVELFRGRLNEQQVLEGVEKGTDPKRADHLCEAYAFIGASYASRAQIDAAKQALSHAIALCPPNFTETYLARRELARLHSIATPNPTVGRQSAIKRRSRVSMIRPWNGRSTLTNSCLAIDRFRGSSVSGSSPIATRFHRNPAHNGRRHPVEPEGDVAS